jgi:hypothetical protein
MPHSDRRRDDFDDENTARLYDDPCVVSAHAREVWMAGSSPALETARNGNAFQRMQRQRLTVLKDELAHEVDACWAEVVDLRLVRRAGRPGPGAAEPPFERATRTPDQPFDGSPLDEETLSIFIPALARSLPATTPPAARAAAEVAPPQSGSVWGYGSMPLTRTVDVHIAGLRRKIEPDPRYLLPTGCELDL